MIGTFTMGVIIGFYAYFAGFSSTERAVTETVEGWTDTLVIVGEAYGGCRMAEFCPSFQVADDGSYRYFYRPAGASEQVLREGIIPSDLHERLRQVATAGELQVASRPIEPAFCESYVDGIDVTYRVTLNDTDYELDSCGTDVDGEGILWQSLSLIWEYFESIS